MSPGPTIDVYTEARAELLKGRMPDLIWPALGCLFGVVTGLFGFGQWIAGSRRFSLAFFVLSAGWLVVCAGFMPGARTGVLNLVVQCILTVGAGLSILRLRRQTAKVLADCRARGEVPPQLRGLVLASMTELESAPAWLYQGEQLPFEDQMRTGALEGLYNNLIAAWVNLRIRQLSRLHASVNARRRGPALPFEAPPSLLERFRVVVADRLKQRHRFQVHYRRHTTWRVYNSLEGFLALMFSALSAAIAVKFEAWEYIVLLCCLPTSLALHRYLPRYRRFRVVRLLARWDYFLSCLYHQQKPEPFIIALLKSSVRPITQTRSAGLRLEGKVYLEIAATVGLLSLLTVPLDVIIGWSRSPNLGQFAIDLSMRQLFATVATVGLTYMLASAYGNSILRYRHQGEASGQGHIAVRVLLGTLLGLGLGLSIGGDSALIASQWLVGVFDAARSEGIVQHSLLSMVARGLGIG